MHVHAIITEALAHLCLDSKVCDCVCSYNCLPWFISVSWSSMMQLIGGLADEKVRWAESVKASDKMLVNIIGDVMVASGAVSYLGAFTVSLYNNSKLVCNTLLMILGYYTYIKIRDTRLREP